jgi:hypothetical protein
LILCSEKNEAVAHYALGNLHNKVLSRQYKFGLPGEKELAQEIAKNGKALLQQTRRTRQSSYSSPSLTRSPKFLCGAP